MDPAERAKFNWLEIQLMLTYTAQCDASHPRGRYKQGSEQTLTKSSCSPFQHCIDTKAKKENCDVREQRQVSVGRRGATTFSEVQEFGSMKVIL